ncbi:MAG: DNA-3-methyladenine glycosylase 2 family protein [Blastocatellia bacterium]
MPKKRNDQLLALDETSLAVAAETLAASDVDFAFLLATYGTPPLWAREPGFPTLVHIILEQQVSLASARAAYNRLQAAIAPVTPERFLQLSEVELKVIGFSRQKALYVRLLAQSILAGALDLSALAELPDDEARTRLKQQKGIGDWTADIYLLMALGRPDIWPCGDLALLVALQRLKKLPARPTHEEFVSYGVAWKPYRAVAARLLWHFYLNS